MTRVSKTSKVMDWLRETPSRMEGIGAADKACKKFKCTDGIFYEAKKRVHLESIKEAQDSTQVKSAKILTAVYENDKEVPMTMLLNDIGKLEEMGLERVRSILELLS